MASRQALITQAQVTRIMRGAKAAGVDMAIIVTPGEVRFVPVSAMEKPDANRAARDDKRESMGQRMAKVVEAQKRARAESQRGAK